MSTPAIRYAECQRIGCEGTPTGRRRTYCSKECADAAAVDKNRKRLEPRSDTVMRRIPQVETFEPRDCTDCGKRVSRYQPGDQCWACANPDANEHLADLDRRCRASA